MGMDESFKNFILSVFLLLVIIVFAVLGYGYYEFIQIVQSNPISEKVEKIMNQEHFVSYDEISSHMINATAAIEDPDYFNHNGIQFSSNINTLVSNYSNNTSDELDTTITQQVARYLYALNPDNFIEKVSEMFLVFELEQQSSKQDILAIYLNILNYGDGYSGIRAATKGYYKKTPIEIGLDEASLLAAIPISPESYQLSNHHKEAKERQKSVLKAMIECNMLTKDEKNYVKNTYGIE